MKKPSTYSTIKNPLPFWIYYLRELYGPILKFGCTHWLEIAYIIQLVMDKNQYLPPLNEKDQ